jgi:hypothetical protein
MNSNSPNSTLSNQNNDSSFTNQNKQQQQQQLPLKAYFLNKYEQLKVNL